MDNLLSQLLRLSLKFSCCLLLFCSSPSISSASTYYVDCENGSDSSNGKSKEYAWKSVEKVNNYTFSPGDTILFVRNCSWQETLTVSSSGTPESPIVFSSYGLNNNNAPVLIGTSHDTIMPTSTVPNKLFNQIFIENKEYYGDCSLTKQGSDFNTYFKLNKPNNNPVSFEKFDKNIGVLIKGSYIVISDIKVTKFKNVGIKVLGTNCLIKNCLIEYIPKTAVQFILSDSSTLLNSTLKKIGYYSNPCCEEKSCGHSGNGVFISSKKDKDKHVIETTDHIQIINCSFETIGSYSGDHGVYDNGHYTSYYNNTFKNCVGTGIKLDGENSVIINNSMYQCITAGILIDGGQGNEILYNELVDCGYESMEWGQQGAIWYLEDTPQIGKHKNGGGATILRNRIISSNYALKIQNAYSLLILKENIISDSKKGHMKFKLPGLTNSYNINEFNYIDTPPNDIDKLELTSNFKSKNNPALDNLFQEQKLIGNISKEQVYKAIDLNAICK